MSCTLPLLAMSHGSKEPSKSRYLSPSAQLPSSTRACRIPWGVGSWPTFFWSLPRPIHYLLGMSCHFLIHPNSLISGYWGSTTTSKICGRYISRSRRKATLRYILINERDYSDRLTSPTATATRSVQIRLHGTSGQVRSNDNSRGKTS